MKARIVKPTETAVAEKQLFNKPFLGGGSVAVT
jgi:hypothetical protein